MSRLLRVCSVLAVFFIPTHFAAGQSDIWASKNVSKLLTDAQRALAAEMNQELKPMPKILLSSRAHVFTIQRRRVRQMVKRYYPEKANDEAFINAQAAAAAAGVFGFYDPPTHTVHLVPENFEAAATYIGQSGIVSNEFVLIVLVHELVHVYDQQNYKIWGKLTQSDQATSQIWGVVTEGHAQYVTERVMSRLQLNKPFYNYTKASFSVPPTTDEVSRHQAEVQARQNHFRYVRGHKFFQDLADYGGPEYANEAFKRPPKSISDILHPQRYIHGTPEGWPQDVDTEPVVKGVLTELTGPEWKQRVTPYTEGQLFARFGDLVSEREVLDAGEHFVSAHAVLATPKKRSNKFVHCVANQMDSPTGAAKLVAVYEKLQAAERLNFEKAGGDYSFHQIGVLIEESRVPHFRETRIREYGGALSSEVFVAFAVKNYVAECHFNESPRSDPELKALITSFGKKLVANNKN